MNSAAHCSFRCPTSQLTISLLSASIAVHVPHAADDEGRRLANLARDVPILPVDERPGDATDRQREIAIVANAFLRASAKVGIIALVDEATGYQEERSADELQLKLKLFLNEYMRKWEKTFPDELWQQFGRLTKWKGSLHQRPKYWGKLVMELIYEYLDPDVARWLDENAPAPRHGQNYFQWLNEQYGLKKLVEHIWKVIGIASTCATMEELRERMEELYGKKPGFQFSLRLKPLQETPPQ